MPATGVMDDADLMDVGIVCRTGLRPFIAARCSRVSTTELKNQLQKLEISMDSVLDHRKDADYIV